MEKKTRFLYTKTLKVEGRGKEEEWRDSGWDL